MYKHATGTSRFSAFASWRLQKRLPNGKKIPGSSIKKARPVAELSTPKIGAEEALRKLQPRSKLPTNKLLKQMWTEGECVIHRHYGIGNIVKVNEQ